MLNQKDPLFSEKHPDDYPDPLVLRPPVGSEVYGSPYVRFQDFFHGDVTRRRRLLLLCSLGMLVTLALSAGLLFTMFLLGYGPFPNYQGTYVHHRPCSRKFKILLPSIHGMMEEQLTARDDSLSATVAGIPMLPVARILHLFDKGLTIIRSQQSCFVRPMRPDLSIAHENGYVQQLIKDTDNWQGPSQATVYPNFWNIGSPEELNIPEDGRIDALCAGTSIFMLVPSGMPNNLLTSPVPDEIQPPMPVIDQIAGEDSFDGEANQVHQGGTENDDIMDFLINQISAKHALSFLSGRFRRKASTMPINHKYVRRSIDHSSVKIVKNPDNCRVISRFLEDVTIPRNSSSSAQASVNLDVILNCFKVAAPTGIKQSV